LRAKVDMTRPTPERKERLAAALRENLKRRKNRARALEPTDSSSAKCDDPALPQDREKGGPNPAPKDN
jgi:hypothetical protein